jgi:hypothetical protein
MHFLSFSPSGYDVFFITGLGKESILGIRLSAYSHGLLSTLPSRLDLTKVVFGTGVVRRLFEILQDSLFLCNHLLFQEVDILVAERFEDLDY